MEDEFGRPLSDDGQWVWDGTAWRPTAAQAVPGGAASPPSDYYQSVYPAPVGPGAAGPGGPDQQPWYRRQLTLVVIIGALLVLSAVLVTVLLLTRGNDHTAAPPSPSATTVAPTTTPPTTPPPTTEAPTTPPPTTPPPTTPPPTSIAPVTTVAPGIYDCTNAGQFFGSIQIRGNAYVTDSHSRGTYQLAPTTDVLTFSGGDLDGFTGTYLPSGPSMDLMQAGETLHCAQ